MPNPFSNETEHPVYSDENVVDAFGHFGCYTTGCGKIIGEAKYNEVTQLLTFTCPDGHHNEMKIII